MIPNFQVPHETEIFPWGGATQGKRFFNHNILCFSITKCQVQWSNAWEFSLIFKLKQTDRQIVKQTYSIEIRPIVWLIFWTSFGSVFLNIMIIIMAFKRKQVLRLEHGIVTSCPFRKYVGPFDQPADRQTGT